MNRADPLVISVLIALDSHSLSREDQGGVNLHKLKKNEIEKSPGVFLEVVGSETSTHDFSHTPASLAPERFLFSH